MWWITCLYHFYKLVFTVNEFILKICLGVSLVHSVDFDSRSVPWSSLPVVSLPIINGFGYGLYTARLASTPSVGVTLGGGL
jgi:hypothetical protein